MIEGGKPDMMFYSDGWEDSDFESLLPYPTVKKHTAGVELFAVPIDAVMPEGLWRVHSNDEDKEWRRRWVDKVDEGFHTGESLALATLQIAARQRTSGNYSLGTILRAAIEAEKYEALQYVARGFICTIVYAAISGRASLAKRMRQADLKQ